jgi:hypothetical protein
VRPPRVAVLVRASAGWIYDARLVLGTVSRVWGGAGQLVVPWRASSIHPVLLDLVRSDDPDYLAVVPITFADWRTKDPGGYASWITVQPFVAEAADRQSAERALSAQLADEPIGEDEAVEELVGRLSAVCSPHRWHDAAPRAEYLHPRQPVPGPLTDMQTLSPLQPADEPLWQLDLSGVDPALALMIETRTGTYNSVDGLGEVLQVPIRDEDLDALVSLAVLGDVGFTTWDLRNRFQQAFGGAMMGFPDNPDENRRRLTWTPFPRSVTGLAELTSVDHIPHAVLVVGDSLDDYALALAYDRLSWRGSWLPTAMADRSHEHFRRLRRAFSWLRRDRQINDLPQSGLFLTSTTVDVGQLSQIAGDLTDGDTGGTERLVAAVQVVTPDQVPTPGRKLWGDPDRYDVRISVPVARDDSGAVELLTEVDLPTPSTIDASAVHDLRWEVDIDVLGHRLPARAALGGSRLLADGDQPAFAAQVRAGADGVTVHSHSQGLVIAGSPLRLARADAPRSGGHLSLGCRRGRCLRTTVGRRTARSNSARVMARPADDGRRPAWPGPSTPQRVHPTEERCERPLRPRHRRAPPGIPHLRASSPGAEPKQIRSQIHPRPTTGNPRPATWSAAGLRTLRLAGVPPRWRPGSGHPMHPLQPPQRTASTKVAPARSRASVVL